MDERSDASNDDSHVDFSDLPSLPPNQIRVLGHVIRNRGLRRSELEAVFSSLPDDEALDAEQLRDILAELVRKKLLNSGESDGETTYHARMRRKTSQIMTIQGIWKALDFGEDDPSLQGEMYSEIRKTRSELANSMLADMSEVDQFPADSAPPEEAQQTGQSLLSDLTIAGRDSMSKREGIPERKPAKQREGKGRTLQADIASSKPKGEEVNSGKEDSATDNRVLDDLAATLRKQTGIHPVVKAEPEKAGLWRKLLSWLGIGDSAG